LEIRQIKKKKIRRLGNNFGGTDSLSFYPPPPPQKKKKTHTHTHQKKKKKKKKKEREERVGIRLRH